MTGMYMSHPVFAEKPFLQGSARGERWRKLCTKKGSAFQGLLLKMRPSPALSDGTASAADRKWGLRAGARGWAKRPEVAFLYLVTPCPARPAPFASFASRSRVLKDALLHMLAVHFTVCPAVMAPRLVPRERLV